MLLYCLPIDRDWTDALETWICEEGLVAWSFYYDEPTALYQLRGYFDNREAGDHAWGAMRQAFPDLPEAMTVETLEDRDWKEAYKLHFQPWSERGLHWVPVWEKESYALPEGEQVIWLDPGMAFGTGNHETTRLCVLRLLDLRDEWGSDRLAKAELVDAGCGSGILALSAQKMGFGSCRGFDNDPDSVVISEENARLCEVDGVPFRWGGLETELSEGCADVLVANIIANVLVAYADLLLTAVRPGGSLILSGILAKEVAEVRGHFVSRAGALWGGITQVDERTMGMWADLRLDRLTN